MADRKSESAEQFLQRGGQVPAPQRVETREERELREANIRRVERQQEISLASRRTGGPSPLVEAQVKQMYTPGGIPLIRKHPLEKVVEGAGKIISGK